MGIKCFTNVKTKMHILKNVVNFLKNRNRKTKSICIICNRRSFRKCTNSIEAAEITKLAKEENLSADVFGPLAFDNSISKNLQQLKELKIWLLVNRCAVSTKCRNWKCFGEMLIFYGHVPQELLLVEKCQSL